MSVFSSITLAEYGATIPREVQMLLESRGNDVVKWIFKNRRVYIKKAQG